jgi:hypothetical protein
LPNSTWFSAKELRRPTTDLAHSGCTEGVDFRLARGVTDST